MPPESEIPQDAIDVGTVGTGFLDRVLGYTAPCPLSGVTGDYTWQIFAVDSFLGLDGGIRKRTLLGALEGRVIGVGELTGEYTRP